MGIQQRIATLWLLTIIGMILHFNYHIGELFYGIDITRADANGEVPVGVVIIRTLYYHFPMLWILLVIYGRTLWLRLGLFLVSAGYSLSHLAHLVGELFTPERSPSQISLLVLVFGLSVLLAFEHYRYWKHNKGYPIKETPSS
ncbi:MAG: hypothetical protein AAF634_14550 [Bacteroidota bacterium]